jgi:hypothetical protein
MRESKRGEHLGLSASRDPKLYVQQLSAYMITEADTCRKYVLPKLYARGGTTIKLASRKLLLTVALSPSAKNRGGAVQNARITCCAIRVIYH